MLTGSGTSSRERHVLQSNLNGIGDMKGHLTSDMESQISDFASSFLTMFPSIHVGIIKYFLYHEMLNLLLDFDLFTGLLQLKDYMHLGRVFTLWTLKQFETLIN